MKKSQRCMVRAVYSPRSVASLTLGLLIDTLRDLKLDGKTKVTFVVVGRWNGICPVSGVLLIPINRKEASLPYVSN